MNEITLTIGGSLGLFLQPAPPALQTIVTARFENFTVTAKGNEMAYTLPSGNLVVVRVDYVDANGNPAEVDGAIVWDTSAETIVTVTPDQQDDHLCTIASASLLGNAQITATADADMGSGTRQLVTTLDVSVVAGEAVTGTITPTGESEPIAPHVAPR